MRNLYVLSAALTLVEQRLREPVTVDALAEAVYCSGSGLQKLFGYAFHCSVGEYLTKRRLTCASRALLDSERSVTEIALDYQYGSPEAFSRAFKRFWGVSPTVFRKSARFPELFPRFEPPTRTGGEHMNQRKPVDISALYDLISALAGTYVLCVDIQGLHDVNTRLGRTAGDLMIAAAFRRIEQALSQDMLLFRIGGDEFAVLTRLTEEGDARALADRIAARNGDTFCVGTQALPLGLWLSVSRIPEGALNYHATLSLLYEALAQTKKEC